MTAAPLLPAPHRPAAPRGARPGPALGAALLVALLWWPPAGGARAQSLLSEPPPDLGLEHLAAAPPGEKAPRGEPRPLTITTLLEMVERGEGALAYPQLKALLQDEVFSGKAEPDYVKDLHRRLLIATLKAGEGLAEPEEQERAARAFVERYPDDPFFPHAFFDLTQALSRQHKPLEESFFFDEAARASLPDWMQTRYLLMRAEAARQKGDPAEAAADLLTELTAPGTLHESGPSEVLHLLQQVADETRLNAVLARFPRVEWLQAEQPFLRAKALGNAGHLREAYLALENIDRAGQARTAGQIRFLRESREEIEQAVLTRPERIGVLLPLSSSNAAVRDLARETLDGLRMAVQFRGRSPTPLERLDDLVAMDLEPPRETVQRPDSALDFELVIKDTGNSPQKAAQGVEELVRRDRVIAIIGPIARAESTAALEKAEEVGVPVLALSITATLPPNPQFAFLNNKGQETEVKDLVRYARDYLAARRFAVLYPDNNFGRTMMNLFWDEVTAQGGQITGAEAYLPWSPADESRMAEGLQDTFNRLAGVSRFLPPEDQALLKALGDEKPEPVVEFDALFIPIAANGSQDIRLIAPYPATVDAEHAHLLGSRYWNTESVLIAGNGKIEGAVFVDLYHRTSGSPENQAFRRLHRHLFRHRQDYQPPSFYTALGYDSLGILTRLLADPGKRTRRRLARALVEMEPYPGLTGLTSFLPSGEAVKESIVLRVSGGEVVPAMHDSTR